MDDTTKSATPRVLTPDSLLSIPEAVQALRISERHFFRLTSQGRIRTLKLGSRTLVPHREILRLIDEALGQAS